MKIAFLTTDNREHHRRYDLAEPYFGTAPEAVLQGLETIPGVEVHVVSCTQQWMKSPEKIGDNIWFHCLLVPKPGWLSTGYQGCVRAVRRKIRQLHPDIVHGQGTERDCAVEAIFSGFPNVVTLHGNMGMLAKLLHARIGSYLWFAAILEGLVLPRALGVFCNSAYTESAVQKRAQRTFRVPNAVRREFFETPSPQVTSRPRPIILNIGVISARKRQLEVLRLAEYLHKQGYDFEIHFVGLANPRDSYVTAFLSQVRAAEGQGFARYFTKLSTEDLVSAMDEASALIHVPSEEAFGLVVAEALARNLKLFGTDVGGISDIAREIEGAELFAVEDGCSLRTAVARWLRSGCPCPRSASAEMRTRYHPNVIARRHLEIYRELVVN